MLFLWILCPYCKWWKEIETWREGKDLIVSLAHICLLFQWNFSLLFSFACSSGSKDPTLQSVMPESASSLVVSYCARMPYGGNTKLSHKWAAPQSGSKRNVFFCCFLFRVFFFLSFFVVFFVYVWSDLQSPVLSDTFLSFFPKFTHAIHKEKYLCPIPGGSLSASYPKELEV